MEEADNDWMVIRMVCGFVFLLVPAQRTKGRITVVVVVVECVVLCVYMCM